MVYKVERDTGDYIAIGVVIGSVANHPDMYRAAILSWNLRELQNQEALKIAGVELMRPMINKHPKTSKTMQIQLSCLMMVLVSFFMYCFYILMSSLWLEK